MRAIPPSTSGHVTYSTGQKQATWRIPPNAYCHVTEFDN
jgi:hypothetical protein